MTIKIGELEHPQVLALLRAHHDDMQLHSPSESVHALDLSGLASSDVTFYCLWIEGQLAGCGALKELNKDHGEIKSMRTAKPFLRRGVAAQLLDHIIEQAQSRNYAKLSLETGTAPAFAPAQKMYQRFGFSDCPPFGDYQLDPYSTFMTLDLVPA